LTIAPFCRSTMWAPTAWDTRHSAVRSVSITSAHSSSVTSRAGRWTRPGVVDEDVDAPGSGNRLLHDLADH
jgi:hypothetical protein